MNARAAGRRWAEVWLVAGLAWACGWSGALAEEAGGRSLEVTSATLSPSVADVAAPGGFQYLVLELRFANTGTTPIEGVALGQQASVLEDGLFPYYGEPSVPVDQSGLWQPATLAPQDGIEASLVVAVPAMPGALALVYEADGIRLEVLVDAVAATGPVTPEPQVSEGPGAIGPAVPNAAEAPVLEAPEEVAEQPVTEAPEEPAVTEEPVTPVPPVAEEAEPTVAEETAPVVTEEPAAEPAAQVAVATDRTSYAAGDTVVVSLSGLPGNPQDWVTLVPVGAPEDAFGEFTYTDGVTAGDFRFRAPPASGTYEVRVYFDYPAGGYVVQARTLVEIGTATAEAETPAEPELAPEPEVQPEPVEPADPAQVTLATDSDIYASGEAIVVAAGGLPGNAEDMVTLVPIGTPDDGYGEWTYTEGVIEGSFTFTAPEPGIYELRVLVAGTLNQVAARLPLRVVAAAEPPTEPEEPEVLAQPDEPVEPIQPEEPAQVTLSTDSDAYRTGDQIVVAASGLPGNAEDMLTLVPVGAPDDAVGERMSTQAATEGSFTFVAPDPGIYEVRVLVAGALNPVAARLPLRVEAAPVEAPVEPAEIVLATDSDTYRPGDPIAVTVSGLPGNAEDMLTVVPADAPDDAYGEWTYTQGATEGSFSFVAPEPGAYEVRVLVAGTLNQVAARLAVTVEAPPAEIVLSTDRDAYRPGNPVAVTASGLPGDAEVMLTLVAADAADDAYGEAYYPQGATEGGFSFAAPEPGAYEVRVVVAGQVAARLAVAVEGPPEPAAPATTPGLSLAQAVYAAGEPMLVAFAVPQDYVTDAWIGVVPADVPHGSGQINDAADVAYSYVGEAHSGVLTLNAPAEPGRYDVRLQGGSQSTLLEVASVGFEVTLDGAPPAEVPVEVAMGLIAPEAPVNVAAAPYGATVLGGFVPEQANDGNRSVYDDYNGYAYAGLGAPLIVDLGQTYELEQVRLLLWDRTDITYGYRLDATVDGSSWQVLADESGGGARGWQEIAFAPTPVRYLRLVGTANGNGGGNIDVVELEAYSRDPVPFAAIAEPVGEAAVPMGDNLAFAVLGGTADGAAPLIDGDSAASGWIADGPLPQPIDIGFNQGGTALVEAVALTTAPREGTTRPQLVELAVATGNPLDPWQSLGRFGLYDGDGWQRLDLPTVETSALRVTILEGHDPALPVALDEIAVLEASAEGTTSILPGTDPGFDGGPNVALAALGGRIERASPTAENYPVDKLIDGQLFYGGVTGWISADAAMPQEVVVSFRDGAAARIAAVALNADAGVTGFESGVRTFEIWASQTTADPAAFSKVGSFYMEPALGWQIYAFAPVTARYVQLRILSNHGAGQTSLGEFEVLEAVAPDYQSILAADPPNLAASALGGHFAVPYGSERLGLIDGRADGPVWDLEYDAPPPPYELVLAFRDQRLATIDGITITPPAGSDPADWASEIKLSVSTGSPIDGFTTIGTYNIAPEPQPQSFSFPPVEARYVQLRILGNGGGRGYAIAEVALSERVEPGVMSALSRLPADALGLPPLAPAPTLPGEPEPNGDLATATPVAPGETRDGLIDPPDDVDVYRLDTSGEPYPGITVAISEDPVLRVGLELLDADGQPIDDQPLYERSGGEAILSWAVPQGEYFLRVHRPPTSIVIQSDMSPSTDNVRDGITAALRAFVGQTTEFEEVSVAGFCEEVIRASEFTNDPAVLDAAVEEINHGCDGTALYGAMSSSLQWVRQQAGGRAVIVITDAEDSGSHDQPLHELWASFAESGARIYGVGYGSAIYYQVGNGLVGSTGGDLLRSWAAATGGGYFEAPTGDAINEVAERIGAELRRASLYSLTVTTPQGEGALSVVEVGESIGGVSAPRRIELIFDASGSMWARDDGSTPRIEIAREVMRNVITGLPDNVEVGLRIYGARYPRDPKERSCTDSELVVPFGPLDRGRLIGIIDGLNPQGQTPIGVSLAALRDDFAGVEGPAVVILITDGIESCDPEPGDPNFPPDVVQALLAEGLEVKVDVVGFAIDESETRDFLRQISDLTGGQYFEAQDADALQAALEEAIRAPYQVVDARGEIVAAGQINDPPLPLIEGTYQVQVAAEPPILVEVAVAIDEETRVLLNKEGEEVGVEIETHPYDPTAIPVSVEPPVLVIPEPLTAPAEIAELQRLLAAQGFDPGPADGRLGPATAGAVREYQEAAGLPVTGESDTALLEQLREPPAIPDGGSTLPATTETASTSGDEGHVPPEVSGSTLPAVLDVDGGVVDSGVDDGGTDDGGGRIASTPPTDAPVAGVDLYDTPVTMYATTASSRVRSGPGTSHEQVTSIPFGGEVTVLGEAEGWFYLETANGQRGFTSGSLLSTTRPTTSTGRITGGGTTPPSVPATPGCRPGETLIEIGPNRFICAVLQ